MVWSSAYFGSTRFAGLAPWQARLVLCFFLIAVVWGIVRCEQSFRPQEAVSSTNKGDAQLYDSIVRRVHAGEDYYEAVGSEMRARNYATRPFFNWRLPGLAWFLGKMPALEIGKWALVTLGSLTLAVWVLILSKQGGFYMGLFGGVLLLGTVVSCFTKSAFLFHELWAGVLIALSIAAGARNRPLSVASGLLALFIRELSLPFVVVMLIMAYKERHRREAIAWLVGIGAFILYLSVHAKIVSGLGIDSDRMNDTWVQLGGWSFVLTTAKWTLLTFFTPWWVDVVLLPLILIGLLGWRGPVGTRVGLSVALYVLAFLIVGRPDNSYWGLMYAPLLALGVLHIPRSMADLWHSAIRPKQ